MELEGYTRVDRSISMMMANVLATGLIIPIFGIPTALFLWIWGTGPIRAAFDAYFQWPVWIILGMVALIVLHELLHGLTWQRLSGVAREDVYYGIKWEALSPYAHLKVPIQMRPYRWGIAMPGLVLGVLPTLAGLISGSGLVFFIGLFMLIGASGDMIVLYLLRKDDPDTLVEDHPDRAGCYVLVR